MKYWNKIVRKNESELPPIFSTVLEKYDFNVVDIINNPHNTEIIEKLEKFYITHCRYNKSKEYNVLDKNFLINFSKINGYSSIISIESKIIGAIGFILIPIRIKNEKMIVSKLLKDDLNKIQHIIDDESTYQIFTYSTYLVVKQSHRGKGYGITLIQESIHYDYNNLGTNRHYFVNNVSRSLNSINLIVWILPINISKLKNIIPSKYVVHPIDYTYNNELNIQRLENKIGEDILLNAWKYYIEKVNTYDFAFFPSYEHWKKWIDVCPTFIIIAGNSVIGILSGMYHHERHIQLGDLYTFKIFFMFANDTSEMLSMLKYTNLSINIDRFIFNQLGNLNPKILKEVGAYPTEKMFINFYNFNKRMKKEQLIVPIF